nr:retrotransposon protein, putative, Ty1-copia subclass [Tanacetum cinerariifolium]
MGAKGFASVAIIDRQIPFEYAIASKSTDVMVMALPTQNIKHLDFMSMFKREKVYGLNFNDWFCSLKLVLRVKKKWFVIDQPIPPAPAIGSPDKSFVKWNAVYDAYNEVACLTLRSMTPKLHRQFENSSHYEMLHELKSMFEKQAGVERICRATGTSWLCPPIKNSRWFNLEGLTSDFSGFGLPKKAATPQVMTIEGGRIQKSKTKSQNAKRKGKGKGNGKDKPVCIPKPKNPKPSAKEYQTKDDACHHYKEVGHWKKNDHVYLAELMKKKKQVGTTSSLVRILFIRPHRMKMVIDLLGLIHMDVCGPLRHVSRQDEDTSPSENTRKIPAEVEGFEPPQEEVDHVCWSVRTHRAPESLCLNVEVEEHSLGDLNEPANCKDALLDPKSNKWLDAMNAEMQSMKDNQVLCLVDLPPNGKTIKSKWLFKKKIDMDGNVHTYQARLVAKAIAAFYDYEIWQMDVKNVFLVGYLDEDIYTVQPKGSIMYAVRCTRPEVMFAQNITSRFQHKPGELHWTVVKTILKYLRNTKDVFLVYGGNPEAELRVTCYCDAGFETDKDDIKSQTGYVFVLNGGVVDWKRSKKRDTAYQHQVFTRKSVFTILDTAYPPSVIR